MESIKRQWKFSLLVILFNIQLFNALSQDLLLSLGRNTEESKAVDFIKKHDLDSSLVCNLVMHYSWDYKTNITRYNWRRMVATQMREAEFKRVKAKQAKRFNWRAFDNLTLKRLFSYASFLGLEALNSQEKREYARLLQSMKRTYQEARVCPYDPNKEFETQFHQLEYVTNDDLFNLSTLIRTGVSSYDNQELELLLSRRQCDSTLKLEPDLTRIMGESRNPRELLHTWKGWRNAAGRPQRRKYFRFIQLVNKAARMNGFENAAEMWTKEYDDDHQDFEDELERLWDEIKPLYEQLHTFVRRRLQQRYGRDYFESYGTLPAHLLGNMWAQNWLNLLDLTVPYPNRPFIDVTRNMNRQKYTPRKIYRVAEEFFLSLGFEPLPPSFMSNSMLERPLNRKVSCRPSAWDFCDGFDFRVKHCTRINMKDLITAHHELGHIYYGMAYRNQPLLFRNGANPGFHEAVGDAVTLSMSTPSHLVKLGLLSVNPTAYEDDINFLFTVALEKLSFLPFALALDKWRWKVFQEEVSEENLNSLWWQLRIKYQGVSPPVIRTPLDFDPGAKYHVVANVPFIRYFVSYILQFQIHEELCIAAGHSGPLHECDIYNSKEAGKSLWKMMKLGKSQPWRIVLSQLSDGRVDNLDARPLLRYFRKLHDWLKQQNINQDVGWDTNEAILAFIGAQVNVSSAAIIGIAIFVCITAIFFGVFVIFLHRKLQSKNSVDLTKQ